MDFDIPPEEKEIYENACKIANKISELLSEEKASVCEAVLALSFLLGETLKKLTENNVLRLTLNHYDETISCLGLIAKAAIAGMVLTRNTKKES